MAEKYNPHDYHTKTIFLVRQIEKQRVRTIIKLLNPHDGDRILEIGCGGGNLLEAFACGELVGVDLSNSLLQLSKSKLYKTRCQFVQAYGDSLPFRDGAFDKIYCSEVLEHVLEPKEICREAYRALRNDGVFVVSVPNEKLIDFFKSASRKLFLDRLIRALSDYPYPDDMTEEWHLHSFDFQTLNQVLAGFFTLQKVVYIPSRFLASRIVALCRKIL